MNKFFTRLLNKIGKLKKATPIGGINVTEQCNLSCVMCHFNGPNSRRQRTSLTIAQTEKFLKGVGGGREVQFAGTGELFMDSNALDHIKLAQKFGFRPAILSNGMLLEPPLIDKLLHLGVRKFTISTDAYTHEGYAAIRRGGDFSKVLSAFECLRKKKEVYKDIILESNNVLFSHTVGQIHDYCEFWKGKIDKVSFFAEYFDIFHFRNTLYEIPEKRCECKLSLYLLPSGYISPCCAINVYEHAGDTAWLPHIDDYSPAAALRYLTDMYRDKTSPLGRICAKCDWWIMFHRNEFGDSPVFLSIPLT